eukprot:m.358835 g.358835  ORF g.358835 m.358835 type:complete len:670 (-) comp16619_c0_seq85:933-2942(-)
MVWTMWTGLTAALACVAGTVHVEATVPPQSAAREVSSTIVVPGQSTILRSSTWWVDPITVKIAHDRRTPFDSTSDGIDLAGMRGECERGQIWGWDDTGDLRDLQLKFAPLSSASGGAVLPASQWTYKQQGYVNVSTSTRYGCLRDILAPPPPPGPPPPPPALNCSDTPWGACWTGCPSVNKNWSDPNSCNGGKTPPPPQGASCNRCECNEKNTSCGAGPQLDCSPGWYPDPLLDVPASGIPLVPTGWTQPVYFELCIPYGQSAGNYTGQFTMTADGRGGIATVEVHVEVWDIDLPLVNDSKAFNTAFNFNSNMSLWYPVGTEPETWWADWLPFLAHYRIPGDSIYLGEPRPTKEYEMLASSGAKWMGMRDAGISFRPPSNGTLPPNYVEDVIEQLAPTMANMSALGLLDKMYVYGFDEMPEQYKDAVYEIFGGLKKKWPTLTTMAVLDWQTFPSDLPLDIWVDEYADYGTSASYLEPTPKETLRQSWLASGETHQFWWYWCIGPTDPHALNTFIERPAIQARMLYWLTALHAVNGMLYYEVDIWATQCPKERPCKSVDRINGTALTDFDPATFPDPSPGSTNGDGSFTYPGPNGAPLGSIRLSNIADGIEDWELFNKLGATASISKAADLITQLVMNITVRQEDPALLERLRREAAHRIMEASRESGPT